jgi:uncharacterized membrane protein
MCAKKNESAVITSPSTCSSSGARRGDIGALTGLAHVGYFYTGEFTDQGFFYSNGVYTTLDYPGATQTVAQGINDLGQIVGYYVDDRGGLHGFIATDPPETPLPPAFVLFTSSLGAMGLLGWRRKRKAQVGCC